MENRTAEYPKTGSALAIAGSTLMVLCGTLLMWVSTAILPNINISYFPNVNTPPGLVLGSIPVIASSVVGGIGLFGFVSGAIVLTAAVLLSAVPSQRTTWGVLILVFSCLSLLGMGGFVAGAVLGIVGGILTLRWKPSAA
jgi:hypothetical protein